jgi:hypothetical protein
MKISGLKLRQLEAECESLRKQLADEKAERALHSRLRGETSFEDMKQWEEEFRNYKPGDGVSLDEMLASLESEENTTEP